jgi:hypothetical protein
MPQAAQHRLGRRPWMHPKVRAVQEQVLQLDPAKIAGLPGVELVGDRLADAADGRLRQGGLRAQHLAQGGLHVTGRQAALLRPPRTRPYPAQLKGLDGYVNPYGNPPHRMADPSRPIGRAVIWSSLRDGPTFVFRQVLWPRRRHEFMNRPGTTGVPVGCVVSQRLSAALRVPGGSAMG